MPPAAKKPFHGVSCRRDPYDLRPALDRISEAVAARLQKAKERPLVVLMGECYSMSSHLMLQQGVMARLLGGGLKIARGFELEYRFLGRCVAETCGAPLALERGADLAAKDVAGRRLLRAFRAAQAVPVRAHDAARAEQPGIGIVLDARDPVTAQAMIALGWSPDAGWPVHAGSRPGVAVRNSLMAGRAVAHAQESGADVYIQNCGIGHLLGWKETRHSYARSLTAALREAGADVLPVLPLGPAFNLSALCGRGQKMLRQNGIAVEGLAARKFLQGSRGEEAFLEKINRHSGHSLGLTPAPDLREREALMSNLLREIPFWLREAGIRCGPEPA